MSISTVLTESEIKALKSENPSERRSIVEDFMNKELDEETVRILCQMLSDEDKGVRDAVSLTLIFNGNPLIPKFIVPLVSSSEIGIRNLAGEVLLRIGENSIDEMEASIELGNDDCKKFIIDLLGLIGKEKPVSKILDVLRTNTNDNVILSCLEALGNIKYQPAIPELIKIYEENELYRPTIIEAFGKMESQEALHFIMDKYYVEDDLTKFSIIESFGSIGNEGTFYFLLSELTKITGPIIWPIISSLCMMKERLGLDIPFDENIKNSILYTLMEAEIKYKIAATSLISVFDDKDIMDALLHIYGEDIEIDKNIRPAFFEFAKIIYHKLAVLIREKPGNLKNLLWLLKDMVDFNGKSLDHLSEIDKRNLSDSFTLCFDNPDEEIRKSSYELLFIINLEFALIFLDTMVEDDNIWNRMKVLEMIESRPGEKIDEVIKKLANDPDEMVRERANWALSQRRITN
ncbi:MAG: hypothetical protein WCJ01_00515 [Ignavibacteria bacterium]